MRNHHRHLSRHAQKRFKPIACTIVALLGISFSISCATKQTVFPRWDAIRPLPPTVTVVIVNCHPLDAWSFERNEEIQKRYINQGYYFIGPGGLNMSAGKYLGTAEFKDEARRSGGNLIVCLGDLTSKSKKTEYRPYDVDKNWQVQFRKREYTETNNWRHYLLFRTDRGVPRQLQLNAVEKKTLGDFKKKILEGYAERERK